jgi:hypothetical protein
MASSGSRPLVDCCLRVLEIGHAESHRFASDDFVRRVGQFDQHFVWAWFQADYDHRLTARVDKVPGRVDDGNVDMADAWRDIECGFAEHRDHAQIFSPVGLGPKPAVQEGVDQQLAWLVLRFRWRSKVRGRECLWRSGSCSCEFFHFGFRASLFQA